MEREAFTFYSSFYEAAKEMPDKDRLAFYDAVIQYALSGETIQLKGIAKMAFALAKPNLDSGIAKIEAGRKSGEVRRTRSRKLNEHAQNDLANTFSENSGTRSENNNKKNRTPSSYSNELQEQEQEQEQEVIVCPEPSSEPPVITLPLNDGTEYPVTESDVEGWKVSYPAVDVMQQLRNMREWLLSNPTRRKTKTGIRRFVTTWLAREQDRGGTRGQPAARSGTTERQGITRTDDIDSIVKNKILESI